MANDSGKNGKERGKYFDSQTYFIKSIVEVCERQLRRFSDHGRSARCGPFKWRDWTGDGANGVSKNAVDCKWQEDRQKPIITRIYLKVLLCIVCACMHRILVYERCVRIQRVNLVRCRYFDFSSAFVPLLQLLCRLVLHNRRSIGRGYRRQGLRRWHAP